MSSPVAGIGSLSVSELRSLVKGRTIAPGDSDYDAARAVFYAGFEKRPAFIVRAADAADIVRVVGIARDHGLELAVRSGGHSNAGHGVTQGGILLDLSDMHAIEINAAAGTAWAEPGLTAIQYTVAAHAHGLATGFGDTGTVGLGGLTTGGGVGYLVRKHGLTIDDLLAAEIVTARGEQLPLDDHTHPDLFWAIRGGGGNFGVVTRFKFRLHQVRNVVGGMLILPASEKVIASFVRQAQAAPEELSGILNIMPAPPMPFLAPEHHGKMIAMAMLMYAGEGAVAEAAVAPFRKIATPLADLVKPIPYPEMYPPVDASYHPLGVGRNMFVDHIDESVAGSILERLRNATGTFAVAQVRVLGGAMARVPADATAFAHRRSPIMLHFATLYEKREDKAEHEAWASAAMTALRQGDAGSYVNFLGDEGPERVRAAYPSPTWERLVEIKRKYDPANLFSVNQNIPPA